MNNSEHSPYFLCNRFKRRPIGRLCCFLLEIFHRINSHDTNQTILATITERKITKALTRGGIEL